MGVIDNRTNDQKMGLAGPRKAIRMRIRSAPAFEIMNFIEVFFMDEKGERLGSVKFSHDEWLAFRAIINAGYAQTREEMSVLLVHEGEHPTLEAISKARAT